MLATPEPPALQDGDDRPGRRGGPAAGAILCASAAALASIRAPSVSLALWQRPPRRALRAESRALLAHAPFSVTGESRPACLGTRLAAAMPIPCPALLADVTGLAVAFAALVGEARVHARLEALVDEGCPLFHADNVGLRLLCTYAGPGTEWVPEPSVNRAGLGGGDNRLIVPDRTMIRRLPAFCVGLFKGDAFPGHAGRGIVHRSAPATARRPRLLLCLDEPGRF